MGVLMVVMMLVVVVVYFAYLVHELIEVMDSVMEMVNDIQKKLDNNI